MATRTILECDRCHMEVRTVATLVQFGVPGRAELCGECIRKLERFLAGEDLEVPP